MTLTSIMTQTPLTGIAEATFTILVTTLDDCLFLIPLVARAASPRVAWIHGSIFVITILALSVMICLVAVLVKEGLSGQGDKEGARETILKATGAVLCWCLAGYYYYKAWSKRRSRIVAQDRSLERPNSGATNNRISDESDMEDDSSACLESSADTEMQILTESDGGDGLTAAHGDEPTVQQPPSQQSNNTIQPWTIVSLTIAGSLDEMSYLSGLIVADVFTPMEICIGSFLASLLTLLLIDTLVRNCGRCLGLLDQIPLYAVIGLFAILLTVNLVWDLVVSE
jgi:hypothetical protein